MATSGSLSISSTSGSVGRKFDLTATINNPAAGSSVTVTAIQPRVKPTGGSGLTVPAAVGTVALGQGLTNTVAATGTGSFPFSVIFHSPSTGSFGPAAHTFDVDALAYFSDGTNLVLGPVSASVVGN